jgi:gliding motility-associated-like protein
MAPTVFGQCTGNDTEPPVLTFTLPLLAGVNSGDTLISECGDILFINASSVSVSDNIDLFLNVSFDEVPEIIGDCSTTDGFVVLLKCTWSATDDCGNTTTKFIYMASYDTTPPVLIGVPSDIILAQGQDFPTLPTIIADDACFGNTLSVTTSVDAQDLACGSVTIYTYTATDACGNIGTAQWKVTAPFADLANAPAVTTTSNLTCLENGTATVSALAATGAPAGFDLYYTLSQNSTILNYNTTGSFAVTGAGSYQINSLLVTAGQVPNFIVLGTTTLAQALTSLTAGQPACGSINVTQSATIVVDAVCPSTCTTPIIELTGSTSAGCGGFGSASVVVSNLVAGTYFLTIEPGTGFLNNGTFEFLPAGDYVVKATNASDFTCFGTLAVTIEGSTGAAPVIANVTATPISSCSATDGSITVETATPGTYTYSFDAGVTTQASNTALGLGAGSYTIIVYDGGCASLPATEVLEASINCPDCGYFDESYTFSCTSPTLCVPFPPAEVQTWDIVVDGAAYIGGFSPCSFDTTVAYSLFTVSGQGNTGPYQIQEWTVNGTVFTGTFNNQIELVTWMNTNDPSGNWVVSEEGGFSILVGGNPGTNYGILRIRRLSNNQVATMQDNLQVTPTGTILTFAPGLHNVFIFSGDPGCDETFAVNVLCLTAVDDAQTTSLNTPTTVVVLTNDIVPGSVTAMTVTSQGANGTAVVNADNTITYTPNDDFCGSDAFVYQICDGAVCDDATVDITITCPPAIVAVDDFGVVDQDSIITLNVAGNDILPGSVTSVTVTLNPDNGTATVNPDFTITYEPIAGFCGSDVFEYEICVGGQCDIAQVLMTVSCPEPLILAVDDSAIVPQDSLIIIGVQDNDILPGSITSVTVTLNPDNGTATVNPDFTITYEPTAGYCGPDVFEYEICVGGQCDIAQVLVTVSCPQPLILAVDDASLTNVNTSVNIAVTANDLFTGILTSVLVTTQPSNGTVTVNADNTITYLPNPDYCGSDAFEYEICIGTLCDIAKVSINISCPVNIDAVNDIASTTPNTAVVIPVIANDVFGTLTFINISIGTNNGQAFLSADSTITYIPASGFCGLDSFQYQICDLTGCDTAWVFVTVNCIVATITAVDDATNTEVNTAVDINVLDNDIIPGTVVSVIVTLQPEFGTATVNANNTITYTPNADYCGADVFEYEVCDDSGCDVAEVTVTIACPPVLLAVDDATNTEVNTAVDINVLDNDIIPGTVVSVIVTLQPEFGTATVNANNTITYTPNADYCGADVFEYEVCDDSGCDVAEVTVTIACPVLLAVDDSTDTEVNAAVEIDVLTNDIIPGTVISVTITTQPANGTAVVNASNTITYTPNPGYCGEDLFEYEVCDSTGCDLADVFIAIACPIVLVAVDDTTSTPIDSAVVINVLDNDIIPTTVNSVIITVDPTNGVAVVNLDNTITYTPIEGYCGLDSLQYEICDSTTCDTALVVINIICPPICLVPDAITDLVSTDTNTVASISPLNNDINDCVITAFDIVTLPANGTILQNPDSTFSYTPNADFCGLDSFQYQLCNITGCDTAWVFVDVTCPVVCLLPDAITDLVSTDTNTVVSISVLDNDINNCTITAFDIVTLPVNGSLLQNPDSTFSYTPDTDFCGLDSFQYELCNEIGCDTAWVFVDVVCPVVCVLPVAANDLATTDTNTLVIIEPLNNDVNNCDITIYNIVDGPFNGILIQNADSTFSYTPDADFCGIDSFQYQLCNEIGCDTAWVFVDVTCPTGLLPIANYDYDEAEAPNTNVTIDILTNDILNDVLDSVTIAIPIQPSSGLATVDANNNIVYVPNTDFCGYDTLVYNLCNSFGCDTAMVVIRIKCGKLIIFNGITPNSDGNNDTWIINGIDEFPDNHVTVFNRWGNMVYDKVGYNNDWKGTWEGSELPFGTYFYCVEDGKGQVYTGWLQLMR